MSLYSPIVHRRMRPDADDTILEEKRKYRTGKGEERENKQAHNSLLLALIRYFFPDFLSCFFPDTYRKLRVDGIKPLPEDISGMVKNSDHWACTGFQVPWKERDAYIIIYLDPASTRSSYQLKLQTEITSLCQALRKPIIPIVVFTQHRDGKSERYCLNRLFPKTPYTPFSSPLVILSDLDWREYADRTNPVAAALMSRMEYLHAEKLQVKKACLSILGSLSLNPAEIRFINDYFEAYLKLDQKEEERFLEEMEKMEISQDIIDLTNSWEERGIRKGIAHGKELGLEQAVCAMLKREFPSEMISEITGMEIGKVRNLAGLE